MESIDGAPNLLVATAGRGARSFLQAVVDTMPVGIMVMDTEYRIVLANRLIRETTGEDDPVVKGLRCHQLSHFSSEPCSGVDDPCPLDTVVETRGAAKVIHTHFSAEGRPSLIEVRAAPILDESGEVTHVIEALRDITTQVEERRATRHELACCRAIARQCPGAHAIVDRAGTLGFTSDGMLDLLGRTAGGLTGVKLIDLVAPDDAESLSEGLRGVDAGGQDLALRFVLAGDGVVPLRAAIAALDDPFGDEIVVTLYPLRNE